MLPSVSRRAIVCALAAAAFSFGFNCKASASTVVVTPPGTTACKAMAKYSTISDAVASVPPASTIYICPGTYPEQVVISKKLTLIGVSSDGLMGATASGANNPVVASPSGGVVVNSADLFQAFPTAAQILVQTPSNSLSSPISVSISNITVDGSNNGLNSCATDLVGIYYQNASGTINHVTTRFQELPQADFGCQDGLAIYAQSGYGTGGIAVVTIENNSVHDYDKNGITADGSGTVATVTGNYVVGIGATPLIAQNGIQVSDGASGKVMNNTVTDDVYVNQSGCSLTAQPYCYTATGILLYDSGGTSASPITVSGNTVSNTQGAIVAITDGAETADYNNVSTNKVTTTPSITGSTVGTILVDAIDLCSDHNTATSNTVFNASGVGVHLDSSCTEPDSSASGASSSAATNTINEACAGVLTGNSGGTQSGTIAYNVALTVGSGDSCPNGTNATVHLTGKARPQPKK
jgi:hypothetical protein